MRATLLYIKSTITALFILVSYVSNAQLVAQFTGSPTSGCAPVVVSFQDVSTGNPNDWQWFIGNGGANFTLFSVLQNPSTTFFNPGVYDIKLIIKNVVGQTSTLIKTAYINVNASPSVNFSGTPQSGCFPLPVNFTDNSIAGSGGITTWQWDFGDGFGSSAQNPPHTYQTSGAYNVSLTVTNSAGCTKTITKNNYINISSGVNAAFTNSAPNGCSVPQTITFQSQSTGTGSLTYLWNFGDNTSSIAQNPTHQFTTNGSFNVSLTVTNSSGCSSTVTHNNAVVIGAVNADFILPVIACVGQQIAITNTSSPTPTSASWNFGNGTTSSNINPIIVYTSPGIYSIQLTSTFGGCTASISHQITISPKPSTSFTGFPTASCTAPLTVNFSNNSSGATTYEWHFGDGTTSTDFNPTHTYNNFGTYSDTLITTNANGCKDSLIRTDYIKINPPTAVINNLPQQGCAPITHTFSANITSVDPLVSYQWFSNGVLFSNAPSPTSTFSLGTYDITLVITTAGGCTDTVVAVGGIKASTKPEAHFSANPTTVCAFNPVQFNDESTGTINQWHWLFGDLTTSNQQNPLHPYEDTGHFSVTLIVGNSGCYDTLTILNYITVTPPIAAFTINASCNAHFVRSFTDASIGADTYLWNFGDNTTSTLPSPSHTYAAVGTYNVSLTVHNNVTGCDHNSTKQVLIADEFANFSASVFDLCKNSNTTFTATSPHTPAGISQYYWDFGDGTTGVFPSTVSHTYFDAGNYTIKLIITDLNGCKDTLIKPNYIKVFGPTANFSVPTPGSCLLSNVTFNDLSTTDGIHPIVEWKWDYEGNNNSQTYTAPPFTHTYATAGQYTVKLIVKDSYGCSIGIEKPNLITISQPVAQFSTPNSPSCPNAPVTFTSTSTGPGLTYHWDFGDGTNPPNATTANPTHLYAADGNYTVKLTVIDLYGCTDDEIKIDYISIHSPQANFTVNSIFTTCPPLIGQFTNTSTYSLNYLWNFGDNSTSINLNPSHTYNNPGIYDVTLTSTSAGGCTSIKHQTITVTGPSGTISYSPLSGCNPLSVNFVGTTQPGVSFIWDFNDGIVTPPSPTNSTPSHTYTVLGAYLPKMILKDAAGCTVPIVGIDTIKVNGVSASFVADTLLRCNNGAVIFTNTSISNEVITGYQWDFGDASSINPNPSPTHFYATPGLYFPKLKVTTTSGCSNTYTTPVPVKVVKTPNISSSASANKCVPATMSFTGNLLNADTSSINWQWTFVNGIDTAKANGQNINSIILPTAGIYTTTLYATNSSGCKDTAYGSVEVYPKPVIDAGNDITICKGTGKTLQATGAPTFSWSPASGLSCTNCPSPTANPDSVKNYTVTGTSSFGCTNTDVVKVTVLYPFKMQPGNNATLCIGKSTILKASGADSYIWQPPVSGLNTYAGNIVTATPTATTNYFAIGKDSLNCFADTVYYFVKVYPIPTVNVGGDKTINIGQSTTLVPIISADVSSVVWSPTNNIISNNYPTVTVKPNTDSRYKVSVTNQGGCAAEAFVNVFVICDGANVYIPNTFSPNGDGVNEIFYPRGTGLFSIKQIRIYNRWGEQVFEKYGFKANDESAGWDGSFKGQKLLPDVYIYVMQIQCNNNQVLEYKGNVALIK